MPKVWVGAWALESERAEAEERDRADGPAATAAVFSSGFPKLFAGEPAQNFPTLQEAAAKPKKKRGVQLKFTIGCVGYGGACRGPAFDPKVSGLNQMLSLPTGPRERSADELEQCRFRGGGGLRYYGYGSGGGNGAAPSSRRPDYSLDDDFRLRSRADEVDSWASTKKFTPTLDSGRQERYGFIGNVGASKADGVDNWSFSKKSTASPIPSVDSDRWVRGTGSRSLLSNEERERPRLVLDPSNPDVVSRPSPFGAARPREEVLAEKGLDWRKIEAEIELKKCSSPTSSQSSRPASVQSSRHGSSVSQASGEASAPNPRPPKVNPFGNAKPREVVLEEKGLDWRKMEADIELKKCSSPTSSQSSRPSSELSNRAGSSVSQASGEAAAPNPRPPKMNPFGNTKSREIILEEKGLDWRKMETEIELKNGGSPTSSQSNRPSSVQSSRPESSVSQASGEAAAPNPRSPKVNPFGNAKPREVLLEEKGMDWRKIDLDLEHRGVERPDTDEEKILKDEIHCLRNKFTKETERQIDLDYAPSSTEQIRSLLVQIGQREKELTQLIHELDDKVRFGVRASMDIRPSSSSDRIPLFADRPPSQSGNSNYSKNMVFMERPRLQRMNDKWCRPLDDRCGFQRDSGFLASRSLDRPSKISERW